MPKATQRIMAITNTQRAGFFHLARFRILPLVSPSPKARGVPAMIRRPVASVSKDAAYAPRTWLPSLRITASSQLISISLQASTKASHTSGLNQ
jgi:hypothetical protein